MGQSGEFANWVVAVGTLVLAAVAVFQETIRGWFYRPKFKVSIKTEPPYCVAVPITNQINGTFIANSVYLAFFVENIGNATARNTEVYAKELRQKRADGTWEPVNTFPPMNLKWPHFTTTTIYFPSIAPGMGKGCALGHIVDPARRSLANEENLRLNLTDQQTSLTFDLQVAPNHRGHIVGPGEYQLDILVAAENARPIKRTIAIALRGIWDSEEKRMLREGIGVAVL